MVRAASDGQLRDLAVCGVLLALQFAAAHAGVGVPAGILLATAALFIFGFRDKWEGEVSAYSVFNAGGKRLPGTYTAEQYDAELRGIPQDEDEPPPSGYRLGGGTAPKRGADAPDADARRRQLAAAAERRAAAAGS